MTPTDRSSPGSMQLSGPHVARTATSPGNSPRAHVHGVLDSLLFFLFFFKKRKEKKRKEEKTMSMSGSHRPDSTNLLVRHKRTDWYRTRSSLACHPVGVPRSDGRRAVLSPPAPRLVSVSSSRRPVCPGAAHSELSSPPYSQREGTGRKAQSELESLGI